MDLSRFTRAPPEALFKQFCIAVIELDGSKTTVKDAKKKYSDLKGQMAMVFRVQFKQRDNVIAMSLMSPLYITDTMKQVIIGQLLSLSREPEVVGVYSATEWLARKKELSL